MAALSGELAALPGREARLTWLVARGKSEPQMPVTQRIEGNLVPGCLARLWLVSSQEAGCFYFQSASDSQIVQGLGTVLCELANGSTRAELQNTPAASLEPLHLERLLTSNRRDAANRLWEAIRACAR